MNVLQVAAFCPSFPGNFIYSLLKLEDEIIKLGGKQVYVFPETAECQLWCKDLKKRSKVYFLPLAKARVKVRTYKTLKKICLRENIDIIHSHFELYDLPTLCVPENVKIFWHVHDNIEISYSRTRNILKRLQYSSIGNRSTIIAVSNSTVEKLKRFGVTSERLCVVANGINTDVLDNLNVNFNKPNLLTMGWDYNRKGIDVILKACQKLKQHHYDFDLSIITSCSTTEKIMDYFNGEVPTWIELRPPSSNMADIYKDFNVFIQASRYETFSFAVCEAAYIGMPVIISNIEGLNWANSLSNTRCFTSGNDYELSLVLKDLFDGFSKMRIDKESKKIIKKYYSTERWAKEIISIYSR